MKRMVRWPSPSMVVASIALFVSLGGVSYGLATGVIDSREIKNNTIRGKDVRNHSLGGSDMRRNGVGGGAIKESTLGPVPAAEGVTRFAVVRGDGASTRSRGVTGVVRSGPGRYQIAFNRDVRPCAYIATVGDEAADSPGGGIATVAGLAVAPNVVVVRTANAANGGARDRSFHLIVSC